METTLTHAITRPDITPGPLAPGAVWSVIFGCTCGDEHTEHTDTLTVVTGLEGDRMLVTTGDGDTFELYAYDDGDGPRWSYGSDADPVLWIRSEPQRLCPTCGRSEWATHQHTDINDGSPITLATCTNPRCGAMIRISR